MSKQSLRDPNIIWRALSQMSGQCIALSGVSSRLSLVPLRYTQIDFEDFLKLKPWVATDPQKIPAYPFEAGGYVGLISYDQFCPQVVSKAPAIVYRVESALLFDHHKSMLRWPMSTDDVATEVESDQQWSAALETALSSDSAHGTHLRALQPKPRCSAQDYLNHVEQALQDIRNGRYYQINLLRFFEFDGLTRADLLARMPVYAGSHAAWFETSRNIIASFSPEQFVSVKAAGDSYYFHTYPMKGTRPRTSDTNDDFIRQELESNLKEQAELNIIIDLLRNDLQAVAIPGSVEVKSAGQVMTLPYAFQRSAHIQAKLRRDISMREFCQAMLPPGSVTGAPKLEVMRAIHEMEGRERRYFMGVVFYLDDFGHFDSAVLIRTTDLDVANQRAVYAAGSGITIKSEPETELHEIQIKLKPMN